ncbi:unnamed protein product [Rotaria sp. Silwood1]|nr:unnamed protein product [Rotaria sp. Silwood1]
MEYDNKAKKELVEFCREQYHDNPHELQIINEFEQDYHVHTPIWWYTRECFTYQMLNRALRIQDVEIIIKMGFFLRDVHQHIKQLYMQMEQHDVFTVYRGNGMSNVDFDEIRKKQGGLMAFNTFLSTSLNENISLEFAQKSLHKLESVGVLFQITVAPSISSAPFASVVSVSAIPNEEEILFSMHTIFRIGQIKQIEGRLWRVELALTSDDDEELKRLTDHMRTETRELSGWDRLGEVLIQMGNVDKAEEVYQIILKETSGDDEKKLGHLYHQLGWIKYYKGAYEEALESYHKAVETYQKSLSPNHLALATTYNNIGLVHYNKENHWNALEFYEEALEIQRKYLSSNHPALATTYNNIGLVYDSMIRYMKALEFYQKALDIREKSLPPNHPDLAISYNNIGLVCDNLGDYSKALDFYQKTLEIYQKSLPPIHSYIANINNNIGQVYYNMEMYPEALSFSERAVQIGQQSLPEFHPQLQLWRQNLDEIRKL